MAGGAAVLTDDTLFSRIDRALFRVEGWPALISGLAVFLLMLMAVWTVGGAISLARPYAAMSTGSNRRCR